MTAGGAPNCASMRRRGWEMPGETAGTVQIALLRAVMPTGKNKVAHGGAAGDSGGRSAARMSRTLLASGNAVFRSPGPAGAELEAILERAVAEHIGPKLDVMVRDAAAWAKIAAAYPFLPTSQTPAEPRPGHRVRVGPARRGRARIPEGRDRTGTGIKSSTMCSGRFIRRRSPAPRSPRLFTSGTSEI
jgi:hypothetical protein